MGKILGNSTVFHPMWQCGIAGARILYVEPQKSLAIAVPNYDNAVVELVPK